MLHIGDASTICHHGHMRPSCGICAGIQEERARIIAALREPSEAYGELHLFIKDALRMCSYPTSDFENHRATAVMDVLADWLEKQNV